MGLFTALVTLPLAPVRGVAWVVEQVVDEADRQLHDPARIRAELMALEFEFEEGRISAAELGGRQEELLDRLRESGALSAGPVAAEWPDVF
jgi:hypothetical protein